MFFGATVGQMVDDRAIVLQEHKESISKNRLRMRPRFWKYTTVILVILLVIGIAWGNGFSFPKRDKAAVIDKAVAYVNERLLFGLATAHVVAVKDLGPVYKVDLDILVKESNTSQSFTSYVSKDGTLLFPAGVDISSYAVETPVDTTVKYKPEQGTEQNYAEDPKKGDLSAQVQIVEYTDFTCSACKELYWTLKLVEEAYPTQVRFVFKNFVIGDTELSQKAAEAAECANAQGKFWEYYDLLFENQKTLSIDTLKQSAVQVGIDTTKFDACLDNGEMASAVAQDKLDGEAAGVVSVPTLFIGDGKVIGAKKFADLDTMIQGTIEGIQYEANSSK